MKTVWFLHKNLLSTIPHMGGFTFYFITLIMFSFTKWFIKHQAVRKNYSLDTHGFESSVWFFCPPLGGDGATYLLHFVILEVGALQGVSLGYFFPHYLFEHIPETIAQFLKTQHSRKTLGQISTHLLQNETVHSAWTHAKTDSFHQNIRHSYEYLTQSINLNTNVAHFKHHHKLSFYLGLMLHIKHVCMYQTW